MCRGSKITELSHVSQTSQSFELNPASLLFYQTDAQENSPGCSLKRLHPQTHTHAFSSFFSFISFNGGKKTKRQVLVRYRLILGADENARQGKGSTHPECTAQDYAKLREKTNASKVKKEKKKKKERKAGELGGRGVGRWVSKYRSCREGGEEMLMSRQSECERRRTTRGQSHNPLPLPERMR